MAAPARPTSAELDILRVLWERGPSTVREVHEALAGERDVGYTGILKLMQIMTAKGFVVRNEDQRAHVYEAREPAEATKRRVAGELMRKVFSGSASQLVLHALEDKKASADEIAEIRKMLDDYEKGRG